MSPPIERLLSIRFNKSRAFTTQLSYQRALLGSRAQYAGRRAYSSEQQTDEVGSGTDEVDLGADSEPEPSIDHGVEQEEGTDELVCRRVPTSYLRHGRTSASSQEKGCLAGRSCFVTGATSGIGYAIAKRFLQKGAARVTTITRSWDRFESATSQMSKQIGISAAGRFHAIHGDLDNRKSITREHRALTRSLAVSDILVNSAGIGQACTFPKTSDYLAQNIIDVNLYATIYLCRRFLSENREFSDSAHEEATSDSTRRRRRSIINISSLLALKGGAGAAIYAASKAGILGFTRALVAEQGSHVRVNAIVPGYIQTPMTAEFSEFEKKSISRKIPARRFGEPEEVADAAVFLATNEYANNCVLNLDGGLSAT